MYSEESHLSPPRSVLTENKAWIVLFKSLKQQKLSNCRICLTSIYQKSLMIKRHNIKGQHLRYRKTNWDICTWRYPPFTPFPILTGDKKTNSRDKMSPYPILHGYYPIPMNSNHFNLGGSNLWKLLQEWVSIPHKHDLFNIQHVGCRLHTPHIASQVNIQHVGCNAYPPYSKPPTDLVGHYCLACPATNLKAPSIYSPALKSTTCITLPVLAPARGLKIILRAFDDWWPIKVLISGSRVVGTEV